MENSENEIVIEKILEQIKGYLFELNSWKSSSASEYVSTEAYNGVEYAFIYQMGISIREIINKENSGGSNAIFNDIDNPKKGIEKSKIISFLHNEISIVQSISKNINVTELIEYADGFSNRAMLLKA